MLDGQQTANMSFRDDPERAARRDGTSTAPNLTRPKERSGTDLNCSESTPGGRPPNPSDYCDIVLCRLEFRLRRLSGHVAEMLRGPSLTLAV